MYVCVDSGDLAFCDHCPTMIYSKCTSILVSSNKQYYEITFDTIFHDSIFLCGVLIIRPSVAPFHT